MKASHNAPTPQLEAGELLHRADQVRTALWDNACKSEGSDLLPRQYSVLHAASGCGPCSQTRLVEATGIDRSTVADIVRRLCARGLLKRRRTKADARAYAVQLTPDGIKALARGRKVSAAVDRALFGRLRAHDRDALERLLGLISAGPAAAAGGDRASVGEAAE
jgi:DNA-binding MarR family transcriptional regulator